MLRNLRFAALFLIFAISSTSCRREAPVQPTIRIAIDQFVGFAPVYLGIENHLFEKRGIKVEAIPVLDTAERTTAFATGRVDAICTTLDSLFLAAGKGVDLVIVFAVDESRGADGIVASSAIKSAKDLKGKNVAFQEGMPSHFLLLWVLKANGVQPQEIHQINMNADSAGAAFVAHKVDAAVTWEPWLSRAKSSGGGRVLVSTAELPGVLVDVLAVRRDLFEKNKAAVDALYEGWMDAIDSYSRSPDTSTTIMSKDLKLSPDEFKANASTLRFANRAFNQQFFNQKAESSAWSLADKAKQVWMGAGLLRTDLDVSRFLTDAVVAADDQKNRH